MKKSLVTLGLAFAALLSVQSAHAELKARVGLSSTTYQLSGDYTGAKSEYTPLTLGITSSLSDGFYVDASYTGGNGKHNGWATANTRTTICGGTVCANAASPNENFDRDDIQAVVGKAFLNSQTGIATGVYVGYKYGKTTLDAAKTGLRWTTESLTTEGVIGGVGVSFPVNGGAAGSVTINGGLGYLGARWKDNNGFNKKANDVLGYSWGLSYTYPITQVFGVTADYKYNSYDYDFSPVSGKNFVVTEKYSSLSATVYYKF